MNFSASIYEQDQDAVFHARQVLPRVEPRGLLAPIDLTVREGESLCLLGQGHAGHLDAWRVLAGLDPVRTGTFQIQGVTVPAAHLAHHPQVQTTDPQPSFGWWDRRTVRAVLHRPVQLTTWSDERTLLRNFHLEDSAERRVRELTLVQQRLLHFARLFRSPPSVLLMPDPTVGLDVMSGRTVLHAIDRARRQCRTAVIWTTNDIMTAATAADRVLVFHGGQVVRSGPRDEVLPEVGTSVVTLEVRGDPDRLVGRVHAQGWFRGLYEVRVGDVTTLTILVGDAQQALFQLPRLAVSADATPQLCKVTALTLDVLLRYWDA